MKPEHRSLLAVVLSVGVLMLWYTFFAPKPPETAESAKPSVEASAQGQAVVEHEDPSPGDNPTAAELPPQVATPEEQVTLNTPKFEVTFSSHGGYLKSLILKNYHATAETDSVLYDMIDPLGDQALGLSCRKCNFSFPKKLAYQITAQNDNSMTLRWDGDRYSLVRTFTLDEERYMIQHELTVINRGDHPLEGQLGLSWFAHNKPTKGGFIQSLKGPPDNKGLVYQMAGSVERLKADDKKQESLERGVISWAGLESRYFLNAVLARQLSEEQALSYEISSEEIGYVLYDPKFVIPVGEKHSSQQSLYVGPKDIHALEATGVGLGSAIDYGWFSIVAVPIIKVLKLFQSFTGNWGVSIILLTVLVKLLMNPLTVKGLKSMKGMQKIQPKLAELKEKYGDDKQRMNQETMALFKTHKVNPMGGCLPMVLQMPIYIALYKVLYNSIELYHAPFLVYKDLAAPDPYFVMPVLLGIFMFLQQKMTPSPSADPTQKKMMMFMPLMFTGFMLFLPMGLVLYILVNTVMTVVQHYMFNHDIRWRDIFRGRIKLS